MHRALYKSDKIRKESQQIFSLLLPVSLLYCSLESLLYKMRAPLHPTNTTKRKDFAIKLHTVPETQEQ
jgi:hypothetical protein